MNLSAPIACPNDCAACVGDCQTRHCNADAFEVRDDPCYHCPSGRDVRAALASEGRRIHAEAALLGREDYRPDPMVDLGNLKDREELEC